MHDHHHHGASSSEDQQRRLTIALALAASYMLAEVAGGLWTGSLALLADAGHMLSDVFALSLSVFAFRLARRPATPQQTYGHHRTEILAALVHGVLLVGVALFILKEAFERIETPREILGAPMLAIAAGGLLVNLAALWILSKGRHDNLNVRGAWLHVMSDALGSIAAIIAGGMIWAFGWSWADPLASLVIAVLIVFSAWSLLREVAGVLMEWAPSHIDVPEVEHSIAALSGVQSVHDLHIWTISSGRISLSGHVVSNAERDHATLLQEVSDLLFERFEISHATIQVETPEFERPGGGGVCFN